MLWREKTVYEKAYDAGHWIIRVRGHMQTACDARHAGASSLYTAGPPAGVAPARTTPARAALLGGAPAGAVFVCAASAGTWCSSR